MKYGKKKSSNGTASNCCNIYCKTKTGFCNKLPLCACVAWPQIVRENSHLEKWHFWHVHPANVCKEFCTRGSFEVLFELLVIEDLDLRLSLVTTINNLSQHTSCRDRMLASIEISKKTKETDNLAFLIQLIRNTEDHDIQRECLSAVKQLHPEFFDRKSIFPYLV